MAVALTEPAAPRECPPAYLGETEVSVEPCGGVHEQSRDDPPRPSPVAG